jgi:hypothetical protein
MTGYKLQMTANGRGWGSVVFPNALGSWMHMQYIYAHGEGEEAGDL